MAGGPGRGVTPGAGGGLRAVRARVPRSPRARPAGRGRRSALSRPGGRGPGSGTGTAPDRRGRRSRSHHAPGTPACWRLHRPRDLHTAPFVGPGEPAVQVTGEAAREMGIVGGRVAFLPGAGQDQRLGMLDDIGVDRLRRGPLPGGQQPPVQRLAAAVENCGWMRTVPALITGTAFTGPGALGSPGDTAVKAFMAGISSP